MSRETASTCCSRKWSTTPSTSSSWGRGQADRDRPRRHRADGARLRPGHPARQGGRLRVEMHTGGKYNDDVFQFSVGLNGVGTKAVNALSEAVRGDRAGATASSAARCFERGRSSKEREGQGAERSPNGTFVGFTPDPEIFGDYQWNAESTSSTGCATTRSSTPGLTLVYNGSIFQSTGGLQDLLAEELGDEPRSTTWYHRRDRARVRLHPHQQLRRDLLQLRQRPAHERRRHPPERVSRGAAQGHQRVRQEELRRPDVFATAWSAPWRSSCRIRSSRARPRTSSARPTCAAGSCRQVRRRWWSGCTRTREAAEASAREDRGQREAAQGAGADQEGGPRACQEDGDPHPQADGLQAPLRRQEGARAETRPPSSSPRATRPAARWSRRATSTPRRSSR